MKQRAVAMMTDIVFLGIMLLSMCVGGACALIALLRREKCWGLSVRGLAVNLGPHFFFAA